MLSERDECLASEMSEQMLPRASNASLTRYVAPREEIGSRIELVELVEVLVEVNPHHSINSVKARCL